ncbi:MAG: AAA family ATPase [Alistipes indistinctus]
MKILDEMSDDREAEHYFTQFKPRPQAETESEPAMPVRKERKSPSSDPLIRFGVDLTLAAREGRLDPVIGRDEEIERLVQILGRRKKNNPVLIGEPGVGKSAIVEGSPSGSWITTCPLHCAINGFCPGRVASLVAGTKYRGEFEERINTLLGELRKTSNVILFIDEIHTIVGAGSTQGSLDTANILKPVLARGELQCIGATTLREFRENIETDGALERRFQKIMVEQPSPEQTLAVLHNIKRQYEEHHGVRYTDAALTACVELTQRYVADRFFPDKALST